MRRLIESDELVTPGIFSRDADKESLERIRKAYQQQPILNILEILADPQSQRVVVLGDPGSGKSTLARYITLVLSSSSPDDALAPLAGWLTVVVELRRYAEDRWRERTFEDFLDYLHVTEGMCVPANVLEEQLREGQCLVIFDGLDELFNPAIRAETSRRITAFSSRYPKSRILVTSRVIGYQRAPFDSAQFKHYMLQELTTPQIKEFAQLWYANACPENHDLSARLSQRVCDAVEHSRPVRELAGNPLILTILAIIGRRQTIPRDRLGVYKHAVTVLVARWDQDAKHLKASDTPEAIDILGAEERHELLRLLARRMQDGHSGIAGNHIHSRELEEIFRDYLIQYELPIVEATKAARFMVSQLRERNFILSRYGGEVYGFVHRAFLEYLAADDIAYRYKETREWDREGLITRIYQKRITDPAWHEVLLLLVGMLPDQDASHVIDRLLELHRNRQNSDDFQILAMAVQALAEVRKIGRLAPQSKALVDELIAATSKAVYANTGHLYDALPALATFSEFWAGRERFLHWFHMRGQFLQTGIVGASPADVAHALYHDAALLRKFAVFGSGGQHRSSALRWLASRWSDRQETLDILRSRAVQDVDYQPRAVALELLATHWADREGILELLSNQAVEDPDEDVRSSALSMLATHWADHPDTLALLRETANEDPASNCRAVALELLATHWADREGILELLSNQAVEDPGEDVRSSALSMLATHWAGHPDTLALLRETANEDPASSCRAVALKLLATHWGEDPDTENLLRSRVREDPDFHPRAVALERLTERNLEQSDTLALLSERALSDPDGYTRGDALRLLADQPLMPETLMEILRSRAVEDSDDHCRGTALRILAEKWNDRLEIFQFVRDRAVEDPDDHCRSSALRMMATYWKEHADTLNFLCARVNEDAGRGPEGAALELLATQWRDEPRTLALLCAIAKRDGPERNRDYALAMLAGYWHDRLEVIATAQEILTTDLDAERRLDALQIVAAGNSTEVARAAALHALTDLSPLVRKGAVWILAFCGENVSHTKEVLRKIAEFDDDEAVRVEAGSALAATQFC
jgi:energy-coupling factor transporter ATP-binding protein EcfA2